MLFQQINKNSPERIWMVYQNADINGSDHIEGQLLNWINGIDTDIGKERMGLQATLWQRGVAPSYGGAGVVRKGSKTVRSGEFGIIQVYGFYDGVLADGSVVIDTIVTPSTTTPGSVIFATPGATLAPVTIGTCLISSTDYVAHGLGNKCGVFLRLM